MTVNRLPDCLDHMRLAIADTQSDRARLFRHQPRSGLGHGSDRAA